MTRRDIAYAVHVVARFCENARLAHKKVVLKVMQYLLHAKKWGIIYGGKGCRLNMEAYTDSYCGACLDTRCSVSGAVVMLVRGGGQLALDDTGSAGVGYLRGRVRCLIRDGSILRQKQDFMERSMNIDGVGVLEDREEGMKLAVNKHASCSTKHVDVKYHLVREVRVVYVRTDGQHADFFIKPLCMQKFNKYAKMLVLNIV